MTSTPLPSVELVTEGAIAWIVAANENRLNAFTSRMWQELPRCVAAAEADDSVRVLILRGKGERAFSTGADISEFETMRTGDSAKVYDALNHDAFVALAHAVKPTIAMIHGFCLGGGLGLAASCDLRLANDKAEFAIPAAKLGIGYNPRWARQLLALSAPAHVKELLFTGRRFNAEEARAIGLVNRICDTSELVSRTFALAEDIAANAPLSVQASKRIINELVTRPEQPDLALLDAEIEACFVSDDYAEGRMAFLEKRRPHFRGR